MSTTTGKQKNLSQKISNKRKRLLPTKYTCPICLDYLLPPIYQCANGHLICDVCRPKVETCPQCREQFVGKSIRNLAVEEIVRETVYECKNLEEGCYLSLNYDQVRDHELDCNFTEMNYCQSLGINCNQKIRMYGIVDHLKNLHGIRGIEITLSNSRLVADVHQMISKIELDIWNVDMSRPHFFLFDGKIFFLKTLVDTKEKCVSWMVCIAGSQKSAEKYEVKVTHFSDDTMALKNSVVWQGGVYTFDKKFADVPTLSIPLKTLVTHDQSNESGPPELRMLSWRTRITINIPDSPSVDQSVPATFLSSVLCCPNPIMNVNNSNSIVNHRATLRERNYFTPHYQYIDLAWEDLIQNH